MAFVGRLFVIFFAIVLASFAAGVAIAIALLGPAWQGMAGDVGERVLFWGTSFIGMTAIGATAFLPMAILIAVAESLKVRSLLVHGVAGAALLLMGYVGSGAPSRYEESIDYAPPPVSRGTQIAAAAGVVFGFTYWLIAGRNAGRWREKRADLVV
jgi:hypothetical protein